MLKPTIFREYDIRGVADTELLSPDVEQLGLGLGSYLRRHSGSKINVGRDCRLSSTRLRDALVKGLLAAGCDVTDIGVVPTPVLYYSAQQLIADGAIMITGSHNPSEYNGFKTVCGSGTLHGETIQEVRRLIERQDFERGAGKSATADVVNTGREPGCRAGGEKHRFSQLGLPCTALANQRDVSQPPNFLHRHRITSV